MIAGKVPVRYLADRCSRRKIASRKGTSAEPFIATLASPLGALCHGRYHPSGAVSPRLPASRGTPSHNGRCCPNRRVDLGEDMRNWLSMLGIAPPSPSQWQARPAHKGAAVLGELLVREAPPVRAQPPVQAPRMVGQLSRTRDLPRRLHLAGRRHLAGTCRRVPRLGLSGPTEIISQYRALGPQSLKGFGTAPNGRPIGSTRSGRWTRDALVMRQKPRKANHVPIRVAS